MKFPDHLIIGPHRYEVTPFAPGEAEAQHLNGRIIHQLLRIELDDTQAPGLKVETLLHEGLHGVWRERNLPRKGEEAIVTTLAPAILSFIKDNPGLIKAILST